MPYTTVLHSLCFQQLSLSYHLCSHAEGQLEAFCSFIASPPCVLISVYRILPNLIMILLYSKWISILSSSVPEPIPHFVV